MAEQTTATAKTRKMAQGPLVEWIDAEGTSSVSDTTSVSSGKVGKRTIKTDLLLDLLRREEGTTLEQMVAATGWLPHSTRAALTGLKKKGHPVSSEKVDGIRIYRVIPAGNDA